jgi:hypothetical protein
MDNEKCDKECDKCNIFDSISETLEGAIKGKRPVLLIAEVSDEMSTILLYGDQTDSAKMLYSAIENDERLEELFLRVMSIKTREMLKEAMGDDFLGKISKMKSKAEASTMSKPKAEC